MKNHLSRHSITSPAARNRARVRRLAEGAIIAALYVALTWVSSLPGLANAAIQVRLSEALCILAYFTPAAVPGMWVGCILANLTTGGMLWDIIFGSLATLLGALGGWCLGSAARALARRSHSVGSTLCKILLPLPTVLSNTVIVPLLLIYVYSTEGALPFFMLTVGIGELLSAWCLGLLLLFSLEARIGRWFS